MVRAVNRFSFMCCVLFVSVLCLASLMMPIFLDCPFLIAPSVFIVLFIVLVLCVVVRAVHRFSFMCCGSCCSSF
jgi:hypothetical protein